MKKLLIVLAIGAFAACNSGSSSSTKILQVQQLIHQLWLRS